MRFKAVGCLHCEITVKCLICYTLITQGIQAYLAGRDTPIYSSLPLPAWHLKNVMKFSIFIIYHDIYYAS